MTRMASPDAVDMAMDALAGTARRSGRSVRGIAKWSHNQRCPTNHAMFAARVDDDYLLTGTEYAPEFGQSPFALARGARVEEIGRRDAYAVTVALLREHFGYGIAEVVPLDLRHQFSYDMGGLRRRALLTKQAIEANVRGRKDAPNIIDGAVLRAAIGGFDAYLEADSVGAKAGPVFHVNEFKGWPVVDEQADDPAKLGATRLQMGIYRYLLGDLIESLGGSLDTVSAKGLLVTPKNVGLTLVGSPVDLVTATRVAETTLANLPNPADFMDVLPPGADFGHVGNVDRPEGARLEALDRVLDTIGTRYQDSCLATCGLAKFCRERAHRASSPALAGAATARFLPGIETLRRASRLADGAPPAIEEVAAGAAPILATAGHLYRQKSTARRPPVVARAPDTRRT
jgi:hypothetical protein